MEALTLACAGAEALVGVAGIIVDQNKSFHYDASLEDALAALAFCALVTLVLRQQERHGLAAFASMVGLLYGGAKGITIGLSHHSVNTASIMAWHCSCVGISIAWKLVENRPRKKLSMRGESGAMRW